MKGYFLRGRPVGGLKILNFTKRRIISSGWKLQYKNSIKSLRNSFANSRFLTVSTYWGFIQKVLQGHLGLDMFSRELITSMNPHEN